MSEYAPDPSVHADPEMAKLCPYCHPERMAAIKDRDSVEAPCSCHAKCKSKGCITRVSVKAGPFCTECNKTLGASARLYA